LRCIHAPMLPDPACADQGPTSPPRDPTDGPGGSLLMTKCSSGGRPARRIIGSMTRSPTTGRP